MQIKIKFMDIIIILSAAAVAFISLYFAYIQPRGQTQVMIQIRNDEKWFFPIDARETVAVKGPIGETIVRIEGNRAWIESSPCDNQTCVAAGFISRQGQWAACLPNNVLLMLFGAKDGNVDSIVW